MITRGRGFEVLVGGVTLGVVLWSASTGCKLSPTTPSGPGCSAAASSLNCIAVSLSVVADGPYTINLQGQYTNQSAAPGSNTSSTYYGLEPGTYIVSGTMSTENLTFYIVTSQSTAVGGVELGTVQSTAGPFVATPSLCHVSYSATGTSPPPQQYSFTFMVGTTTPLC